MLTPYLKQLLQQEDLDAASAAMALNAMLSGSDEVQSAAFLALLSAKGETADELLSFIEVMQSKMNAVITTHRVLDIVGTGGDGFNTVNISTGSALLAAACGVKIAKHGNRSVSSMAGAADVLEQLGINIHCSAAEVSESIERHNFGFCFAPNFHPALTTLKMPRKKLQVPTMFNLIGPLLNPARAQYLMIGVADASKMDIVAGVLSKLNIEKAIVFHCAGLDELCGVAPVQMIEVNQSEITESIFEPLDYGVARCRIDDLQGGSAADNAKILQAALSGDDSPVADTLILNAGMACYLYGVSQTIEAGLVLAKSVQASGAAIQLIEKLKVATHA